MEPMFCPKCRGELKPVYRKAYKQGNEYKTIEGAVAKPDEWLCENCRRFFKIEEVGILCWYSDENT